MLSDCEMNQRDKELNKNKNKSKRSKRSDSGTDLEPNQTPKLKQNPQYHLVLCLITVAYCFSMEDHHEAQFV